MTKKDRRIRQRLQGNAFNTDLKCFTHTISILLYLLIFAPFDGFAATFPDKRGQLTIDILSFYNNYHLIPLKNAMHLCRHS